jgi:hypothetical protein
MKSAQGWKRPFDEPIPLSRGRHLVSLKDAANYIQKLPKTEQMLEEWQVAVEALLLVVELNGPTMMARIGMLRALNRNVERVFNPSRKDTHWGKRKLKRTNDNRPASHCVDCSAANDLGVLTTDVASHLRDVRLGLWW